MKEKHTIIVTGIELNLISDESGEYVAEIAKKVDSDITQIVTSKKNITKLEAAIVCALGYFDEKIKTAGDLNNVKKQRDDVIRENQRLKSELDEYKRKATQK